MLVTILGRPISKKNSRRNFGRVSLPSLAFVKFHESALAQIGMYHTPIKGEVNISYTFLMKGKLDSDCDNMIGGINDILQDAGIIENDKFITSGSFEKIAGQQEWKTLLEIEKH